MRISSEIQNLKCGGCGNTIIGRLGALDDVDKVAVNDDEGTVSLSHDMGTTLDAVRQTTLAKLGYPMMNVKNTFGRKARLYISCALDKMGN